MYNILIVEDQSMPRQLFEMFINSVSDYNLVASIDNSDVSDIYCIKNSIDLVLMDVMTKGSSTGLDAARKIKKNSPNTKIVIVTSMPECSYIDVAKSIGVEGFWYKDLSKDPILDVVKRVLDGEIVYPLSNPIVTIGNAKSNEFTVREIETLRLLINGDTDKEIAEKLCVSVETVHSRIKDILCKTGFKSRTQLAVKLMSSGFVIGDKN